MITCIAEKDAMVAEVIAERKSAIAQVDALMAETERLYSLLKEHEINN